jgi:hypothetical protein
MKKIALFAFSEDLGVFAHIMMNAIDMKKLCPQTTVVLVNSILSTSCNSYSYH